MSDKIKTTQKGSIEAYVVIDMDSATADLSDMVKDKKQEIISTLEKKDYILKDTVKIISPEESQYIEEDTIDVTFDISNDIVIYPGWKGDRFNPPENAEFENMLTYDDISNTIREAVSNAGIPVQDICLDDSTLENEEDIGIRLAEEDEMARESRYMMDDRY